MWTYSDSVVDFLGHVVGHQLKLVLRDVIYGSNHVRDEIGLRGATPPRGSPYLEPKLKHKMKTVKLTDTVKERETTSRSSSSKLSPNSVSWGSEGSSHPPMERVWRRDTRSGFFLGSLIERGGRCRRVCTTQPNARHWEAFTGHNTVFGSLTQPSEVWYKKCIKMSAFLELTKLIFEWRSKEATLLLCLPH